MRAWHHGWSLSRGFAPPVELDGALRTRVGQPGRGEEYLVLDADAHPRRIDRAASAALSHRDPWVSVPTADPGRTADRLREHGFACAEVPEWLMTIDLADQRRTPLPEGYRSGSDVSADGGTVEVRVLLGDDLAASGRLGLAGDHAVPDMITTEKGHRRRGLGGAMMGLLADAARERGADRGVLVASDEGRRLYLTLGWDLAGAVVIGRQV